MRLSPAQRILMGRYPGRGGAGGSAGVSYDPETRIAMKFGQGNAYVNCGPFYPMQSVIVGATNTNPIEITTQEAHQLQTNDRVTNSGVGGNTAANGTFTVTRVSATKFTIPVAGNGVYTSGGECVPIFEDSWWAGWARSGETGGYFAGTADAGAHVFLIGFGGNNPPAHLTVQFWGGLGGAQTWNIISAVYGYEIGPNEWFHWAIGIKSNVVYIYVNGVCCCQQTLVTTPRRTPTTTGGDTLMFGGPVDHLMWGGHIGNVEGYDSQNKFPHPAASNPAVSFIPARNLRTYYTLSGVAVEADFAMDFTTPQGVLTDHSRTGRIGVKHPGVVMGVKDYSGLQRLNQAPMPEFEIVTDSPLRRDLALTDVLTLGARVPTPVAAPAGSRIWDSFARANRTYANGRAANLSLGSTEDASAVGGLAPQAWVQDVAGSALVEDRIPFGILGGRAVYLETRANGVALVDGGAGSANDQVSCSGYYAGNNTGTLGTVGVAFRGTDAANFRYAVLDRNTGYLITGVFVGGNTQAPDGGATAQVSGVNALISQSTSNLLKVRPNGTTIEYYVGNTLVLTQTGQTTLQNATKCGLFALFDNGVLTSLPRWVQFRSGTNN